MKKILYSFLTIFAAVALVACENDNLSINDGKSTGTVDLSALQVTCDYDSEILRSSNNDFIITITEKSTNTQIEQWQYSEMPEVCTLIAGTYILKAESCQLQDAAWEAPYYADEEEFEVKVDKVTVIGDLVCILKNVKVTIEISDDLMAVLGDDCNVNVALGKGELNFTKDETRAGYFAVEESNNILHAYFSGSVDGYVDNIYNEFEDVKAGEWRILRYSLKQNNEQYEEKGSFAANLLVDVSCNTIEKNIQVEIEEDIITDPDPEPQPGGNDDPIVPVNGPVITASTFDIKEPQVITDDLVIMVEIKSELPLTGLVVDIVSELLTDEALKDVGLSSHLDLVNPGEFREYLINFGFPIGDEVLGKNEVSFDITPFGVLLKMLGNGTHEFVLTATDEGGNVTTETLTLIAQ